MRGRRDDGSATVLVLAVCGAVTAAAALLAGTGVAAVTRHRAALAADAAALAAAADVTLLPGSVCASAAKALAANGARLVECRVDGAVVVVRARVSAPRWIGWAGAAEGRARAGPGTDVEIAEKPA